MSSKGTRIQIAAALVVASAPALTFAQAPGRQLSPAAAERPLSPELEALNPPVPEDLVLTEDRKIPAEKRAAAYANPRWVAPKTSWGHPSIEGVYSTEDMRGIPLERPESLGTQEFLPEALYLDRARRQQAGTQHAENVQTFHRVTYGSRVFGYSSLVVDPPNGRLPPLTADGAARAAAVAGSGSFGNGPFDKFTDFSLYDRCISRSLSAGMSAVLYGNGVVIAQSPNLVTITYEMIHETRVIPLDNRPHLDGAITQYNGNSRGRWEGDTLVIETRGFKDNTSIARGAPNSLNMRTTERIRRIDPDMLEYRITVDDPDTFAAPFTVRTVWSVQPGYEVFEYSCHEGNFAVSGGLAGERMFEREVEEARAKGLPLPQRSSMDIYAAPDENAQIIDINRGQ